MNKKIIFITGGARSGKSSFAQELAARFPDPMAYLATAQAFDEEMTERIRRHKASRPANWTTLEEPLHVAECLDTQGSRFRLILLDCLTLWVSNLMMAGKGEIEILQDGERMMESAGRAPCSVILVGNEVGMGIVPENAQARAFRDATGLLQQKIARRADEVYFVVSGIPQKLKG
ncbi:MAG TPA: bifunctional adenosylcobinamide kinase/adenosylcobinamide-phosphate guanylyltransferase [Thermodesulfobacteriota bacterium]|nr:bifunctional adenosylcobinamide kinase/adenosylcobinamide-phosphate guanylyltransferase [Thermodesulfobacteriota bacterium]